MTKEVFEMAHKVAPIEQQDVRDVEKENSMTANHKIYVIEEDDRKWMILF